MAGHQRWRRAVWDLWARACTTGGKVGGTGWAPAWRGAGVGLAGPRLHPVQALPKTPTALLSGPFGFMSPRCWRVLVYLLGPASDATTYCRPWVWCAPDRMYCSEPRAARDVASVSSLAALASLMG